MVDNESRRLSEELNLKAVILQRQIAVIDELMMHKSRVINTDTATFYVDAMNKYAGFFSAIFDSLYSSFLVGFLAFLGVKVNRNHQLIPDRWGKSSVHMLAKLNGKSDEYMQIVNKYFDEIVMIDELRNHIAHATSDVELKELYIPSYNKLVHILNEVSGFVMAIHDDIHGIPGWNSPHLLEADNEYAKDTEQLVHDISHSEESDIMRQIYLESRTNHRATSGI